MNLRRSRKLSSSKNIKKHTVEKASVTVVMRDCHHQSKNPIPLPHSIGRSQHGATICESSLRYLRAFTSVRGDAGSVVVASSQNLVHTLASFRLLRQDYTLRKSERRVCQRIGIGPTKLAALSTIIVEPLLTSSRGCQGGG